MYYFYFCSWDSTSEGKQSIGVAVSDNPVSGFTDIGHPLVRGTDTPNESSTWNDIVRRFGLKRMNRARNIDIFAGKGKKLYM